MTKQRDNSFTGFVSPEGAKGEHTVSLFRSQEGAIQIGMARNQHMLFKPRAEPAVAESQTQLRAGSMRRKDEFTKDSAVSRNRTRSQTHTLTPQHHHQELTSKPEAGRKSSPLQSTTGRLPGFCHSSPPEERTIKTSHSENLPWTTTPLFSP